MKERDIQPRLQKVAEQVPGAKVAILRTNTVNPPKRSAWLKEQVNSGVNVIICSQELVKVGLDLLATPTLIFYQLSFSLFTLNQERKKTLAHWSNKAMQNFLSWIPRNIPRTDGAINCPKE